jgi:hypothetical protein
VARAFNEFAEPELIRLESTFFGETPSEWSR